MRKIFIFILFVFISCEDKKDTTPPETTIISPTASSTVNEVVNVTCMSTDNKGVEKVELWVDGVNTSLTDNTEPYSLQWNTTTYTDGNHTLVVRAYDTNGNEGDSAPITVKVDNTISVPNPVNVTEVSYTLTEMTVKWLESNDADFSKYTLLYSQSESGNKETTETYNDKAKTSYTTSSFDPTKENWYWIEVADSFGYSIIGTGKTNTIDNPPAKPVLNLINYDRESSQLKFSWEKSNDNDFASYKIYESDSSSMSSPVEKFSSENNTVTNFDLSFDKDLTKYYQLEVKDKWGLTNLSDIQAGDSHDWFAETYTQDGYQYSGVDVHQTSDQGFIVLSSIWSGSYSFAMLIKTDSYGKKEWTKSFNENGELGSLSPESIEKTLDGGYIFISKEVKSGGEANYSVRKTDSFGTLEWEKKFIAQNKYSYSKIKNTSDGGYVILGLKNDELWLCKINASGEEIWSQNNFTSLSQQSSVDVEQTSDGGFILLGGHGSDKWFIVKTSKSGSTLWVDESFGNGFLPKSILVIPNGYIATGGTAGGFVISKSGDNGQGRMTLYPSPKQSSVGFTIEHSGDGGYIITGVYDDSQGRVTLFINKTYPDKGAMPSMEWSKSLVIGKDGSRGYSGRLTSDGGYIILGSIYTGNGVDLILIKTDKDGNTKPGILKDRD